MHEVFITRAEWQGLPLEKIMVRENCVLLHPGGKGLGACHQQAHTERGRDSLIYYLLTKEGETAVWDWLNSLRPFTRSTLIADKQRLITRLKE